MKTYSTKSTVNNIKTVILVVLFSIILLSLILFVIKPQIEHLRYPLAYQDIVNKYSKQYNVSPSLIYAVIRTESNFEVNARSHADAKGLMQITDDTNQWICEYLLHEDAEESDIYDPDTNIKRGTRLLSYLLTQYEVKGSALAAYNAGYSRVNSWLSDEQYSHDGKTLYQIPYEETRRYVEKVQTAESVYSRLYPDILSEK